MPKSQSNASSLPCHLTAGERVLCLTYRNFSNFFCVLFFCLDRLPDNQTSHKKDALWRICVDEAARSKNFLILVYNNLSWVLVRQNTGHWYSARVQPANIMGCGCHEGRVTWHSNIQWWPLTYPLHEQWKHGVQPRIIYAKTLCVFWI